MCGYTIGHNRFRSMTKDPVRPTKTVFAGNRLLAAIPRRDRLHFIAGSEEIELARADVICEPGGRMRHVYFPTGGFVSLVRAIDSSDHLEVGLVGSEGMVGASLALGVATSPLRVVVQGAGSSLRMASAGFRRELDGCPPLRRTLDRYLHVRMTQLANAIACNRFHVVEGRLASWLLTMQERARSDGFHATHELLAAMLGVRRVGVTKAATSLQALGLIRYRRGNVSILDRSGLVAASCGCHRADEEIYRGILG
jgi:CRP-like cAMP-binding protein